MDPDSNWAKILDPNPYSMNLYPQNWIPIKKWTMGSRARVGTLLYLY